MSPKEKEFVDYWSKRRKTWSWKKYSYQTFVTLALPVALLIDFINFFIIGDTAYTFFTFSHLFNFVFNLVLIAIPVILISGIANWNLNENRYWRILRENNNKLQ